LLISNTSNGIAALKTKPHVVVGTPGRILDMMKRRILDVQNIKITVLDEADEMLSKGFVEQIQEMFHFIPGKCQVGIFSATMPLEVLEISKKLLNNPMSIIVKNEDVTLRGIKQFYVNCNREEWKLDTLCDLYENFRINQAVIFCSSKKKADWLASEMTKREFPVSVTHGDLQGDERVLVMQKFKQGNARVLITTDLLARGIDVQQVSVVINYDLPKYKETYIHRIGRSGRFGRKGLAINLVVPNDSVHLQEIERFYHTKVEELPANLSELI